MWTSVASDVTSRWRIVSAYEARCDVFWGGVERAPEQLDLFEWGGCACFSPGEEEMNDE